MRYHPAWHAVVLVHIASSTTTVTSTLGSLSFQQLNTDGDGCWERAEVISFVRSLSSTEFDDPQEVDAAVQKILSNMNSKADECISVDELNSYMCGHRACCPLCSLFVGFVLCWGLGARDELSLFATTNAECSRMMAVVACFGLCVRTILRFVEKIFAKRGYQLIGKLLRGWNTRRSCPLLLLH